VIYLIETGHAAGPPFAQRIMIGRQGEIEGKVNLDTRLIGSS